MAAVSDVDNDDDNINTTNSNNESTMVTTQDLKPAFNHTTKTDASPTEWTEPG